MRLTPLLPLLLLACAGLDDGPCAEDRVTIAHDEVTAEGFSAEDILAFARGEHAARLSLGRLGSAALTVTVEPDGTLASWTHRSPSPPAFDAAEQTVAAEPVCSDGLSIPATVALQAPELLDAEGRVELLADDLHRATFVLRADARRIGMSGLIPDEGYRHAVLVFEGTISSEYGTSGRVRMSAVRTDTGARESWDVGTWAAP